MASAPGPAASERLYVRLDDDPLYAQAHLGNEFRAICGLTPAQFLQRRRASPARHDHVHTHAHHAR